MDVQQQTAAAVRAGRRVSLIFGVFLLCIFGLIFFFALYNPPIHPPKFRVDSLSVSPWSFNLSSRTIAAKWNTAFFIQNPNSLKTGYSDIFVSVSYKSQNLDRRYIFDSVKEPKRKNMTYNVSMCVVEDHYDEWVYFDIDRLLRRDRILEFNLDFEAAFWYHYFHYFNRARYFKVSCENIQVQFNSSDATSGTMIGNPKDCKLQSFIRF